MRKFIFTVAVAFAASALACGGQESAESRMEHVADELEDNVEQAGEIMEDAYDEAREQGEDAVEAAGDAYDAVLEEGDEKADE